MHATSEAKTPDLCRLTVALAHVFVRVVCPQLLVLVVEAQEGKGNVEEQRVNVRLDHLVLRLAGETGSRGTENTRRGKERSSGGSEVAA